MRLMILMLMSAVVLSGCFKNQIGPTEDDFKTYLEQKFSKGLTITDIEIIASQNLGTDVEPVVKSRIKGEFRLVEDFYKYSNRVSGKDVLVKIADEGTKMDLFGLSVSKLESNIWNIRFTELEIKPDVKGRPLSHWAKGSYVIKGSSEEKALIIKQEAANAAWRHKMQTLRTFMTGKWVSQKPIVEHNDQYVSIGGMVGSGTREHIIYSLNIPPGTDLEGTATATLFGSKNLHKPITVEVSYKIFDIGEVHVKELESKCIGSWCTSDRWTLNSTTKGALLGSNRGGRTAYSMTLFHK